MTDTKLVTAKVTVRELVPALVDDYISFFDGVYHDDPWLNTKDNPWWGICYCGFYDDPKRARAEQGSQCSDGKSEATRRVYPVWKGSWSPSLLGWSSSGLGQCRTTTRLLESPGTSGRSGGERFCRIDPMLCDLRASS